MFCCCSWLFLFGCTRKMASQVVLVVKNTPANAGDVGNLTSIPRSGRYPGVGHGNPLQYSCLENPMNRGVWWAMVHRVAKSQTQLKCLRRDACTEREKLHFLFWWGSYKGMTHNCWWPCLPFTQSGWKVQRDTQRSYNQQLFIKHLLCVKTESGVKDT